MEVEAEAVDFLKLEVEAEVEAATNSPLPDTLAVKDYSARDISECNTV